MYPAPTLGAIQGQGHRDQDYISAPKNKEMARFGRREGTREARQGRQRAGTRTSALVPGSGWHPRSTLAGGGGERSTMLATRASSSESKEVRFGCKR